MNRTHFYKFSPILISILLLQGSCSQDQDITRWSLPEGAKARLGKGKLSGNVAYSPDGNQLAVASSVGIWLYDAHTGAERSLIAGHKEAVESSVVFSPGGGTLASGSGDWYSKDNTIR